MESNVQSPRPGHDFRRKRMKHERNMKKQILTGIKHTQKAFPHHPTYIPVHCSRARRLRTAPQTFPAPFAVTERAIPCSTSVYSWLKLRRHQPRMAQLSLALLFSALHFLFFVFGGVVSLMLSLLVYFSPCPLPWCFCARARSFSFFF